MTLKFATPANVRFISFRNQYVASLTLRKKSPLSQAPTEPPHPSDRKVTCLKDFILMPRPHEEDGGQEQFIIDTELDFSNPTKGQQITELDIIMKQPSFQWQKIGLTDLKCFSAVKTEDGKKAEGQLQSELGRLSEIMKRSAEATSSSAVGIYRFDANGYNIDSFTTTRRQPLQRVVVAAGSPGAAGGWTLRERASLAPP